MKNMPKNNQERWIAILGDQVRSRIVDNRELELQATKQRIEEINERLASHLVVPITMSQGDEIQALVRDPDAAWHVIETFDTSSWIHSFRFTLGVGTLSTDFADRTWEMDGTCFHEARDAMDVAKRESRWVTASGFGDPADRIVNGVIRSLQELRESWTKRQREAYSVRRGAERQQTAARLMGLDPSTMSKMLKAARYKSYMETERALRDLMMLIWGGMVGEKEG